MFVLLMLLTALLTLAFFIALARYLVVISETLAQIGGYPDSYLAKLRLGLRAIETETGHLPVEATKLNTGLSAVASELSAVDEHLVGTINAVLKQGSH
ncbi:MAG: hypothetical protein ETSY1_21510 [Candidatus Entotheonella factor]|uniref:Uncharacterized protein n=1 Tax=Entotheonella factor TaxID=1429438 RepID=W4LJ50_ENTF1|nr:MAG: hypothetical protein ETSY1_21510 [Candidatus Entotheonella factor]